jgi:GT2 family glycosyltransferase
VPESVDVIIGTYGSWEVWGVLAHRARLSVDNQTVLPNSVYEVHDQSLALARNNGALDSTADWLIFLDADDELDPHYIEEMLKGTGDIRWPSTIGFYENGQMDDFAVPHEPRSSLLVGNHMVIGSMVRREMFIDVAGFRELPVLEDWDLWIRLTLAGAQAVSCPNAIYRVHVHSDSRNQNIDLHSRTYTEIQQRYQDEWNAKFRNL